jgi:endonuclease/exonuclease/phosphatase family metal-dependent hydrolase
MVSSLPFNGAASHQYPATFCLASTATEAFANRYQVFDQFVVSRGLLTEPGLRPDTASVRIIDDERVGTTSKTTRGDRGTKHGASDHLPITATLVY